MIEELVSLFEALFSIAKREGDAAATAALRTALASLQAGRSWLKPLEASEDERVRKLSEAEAAKRLDAMTVPDPYADADDAGSEDP